VLEVRRSRDRGYDDHGWLKTYYTFAFADYYDPEHVDFGPLKVMNEDRLKAGKGYPDEEISPPGNVILQHGREADLIVFDLPAGVQPPKRKSTSRPESKTSA
jgi:hypothetical protein